MEGRCVQDWVTIRAGASSNGFAVAQGSEGWLDLGDVEDLVFILDVRELQAPTVVKMAYETSPTRQETSFVSMVSPFLMTTGVRVDRVFATYAPIPPARYVRWRLVPVTNAAYDVTFRIWVATYSWVRSAS